MRTDTPAIRDGVLVESVDGFTGEVTSVGAYSAYVRGDDGEVRRFAHSRLRVVAPS